MEILPEPIQIISQIAQQETSPDSRPIQTVSSEGPANTEEALQKEQSALPEDQPLDNSLTTKSKRRATMADLKRMKEEVLAFENPEYFLEQLNS